MACYGYCRVSTTRQSEEGESLDQQERAITGYAMMHDLTVDRTFVERGVSGSTPLSERPRGAELLGGLKAGDIVITAKLDRMFRSALDALGVLAGLQKRGVSLHMIDLGGDVTGNGISKLVFTILSAVAEAERDRIRERVATSKADQKGRGRYLGGSVPFGWRVEKRSEGGKRLAYLVPVAEEQAAVERMRGLHSAGKSLRAIAADVSSAGLKVSHVTVAKALAGG